MKFKVYKNSFAVYKLNANESIPEWIDTSEFCSITNTEDELSIVCRDKNIESEIKCERDFRLLKIEDILDFSLVGILSKITTILAEANISVFAISTYNTDYILVKNDNLKKVIDLLKENDHIIIEE